MTPRLRIRPATLEDARELSALAQRLFEQTYLPTNDARNIKAYVSKAFTLNAQLDELHDPDRRYFVCESEVESGSAMVAYALLRASAVQPLVPGNKQMELERFYVDELLHGSGLAHELMDEAMAIATGTGIDSIWLNVWEHNARAIAFYRKRGFVDAGASTFELGDEKQTDRTMWRSVQVR